MSIQAPQESRVDYLKFLFETDHDSFQAHQLSTYHSGLISIDVSPDNRAVTSLTVLPRKSDGRSRYIIEIWGPAADEFLWHVPLPWLNNLRRIDYRIELGNLTADQFRHATRWLALQPHKMNRSTFESKPRQKRGGDRDVGGIGLYYGSRRSRRHAVIYKRGNEKPAYEYRAQDEHAAELGAAMAGEVSAATYTNAWVAAHAILWPVAVKFAADCMGAKYEEAITNAATNGKKLGEVAAQLGMFDETPEERAWWSDQTPEEQLDWQRSTVELTPKGWAATTQPKLLPGPVSDVNDLDDTLPF